MCLIDLPVCRKAAIVAAREPGRTIQRRPDQDHETRSEARQVPSMFGRLASTDEVSTYGRIDC